MTGEPWFTPGVPLVLDAKGRGAEAEPGELALVQPGKGRARVLEIVGSAKRIENVLEALLLETGARQPFEPFDLPAPEPAKPAPALMGGSVEPTPPAPSPSLEGRVDLRDLLAFTIDPETAKDFDDALSFRREGDGIRAWVHIADVSYFVEAGTPLDHGAAARAFSTYVPGLVAPMLPHELADDLCSLRPGVDRLTVTVEFPPGGGEPELYRSVIRSRARLTYGEAQRGEAGPEVQAALALAEEYSARLRRARFARGALRIETGETQFAFDGRGGVARAYRESEPESHALVEELMIAANEAVARLLASRRREALYRVHERPDPQAISLLLAKLADLGVPTPPAPERIDPADAARLAGAISDRVAAYAEQSGRGREAFPSLVLRSLKQARYDPANLGHAGLASRAYCHFTSPIRRYPDLVVHRALLQELGQGTDPVPEDLAGLAEHTSLREREAARTEYLADEICLAWLLDRELFERGWEERFDGEIVGLIGSGLFVRFGEVFEGFLPARRLPGEYFELSELGTAMRGRRSGRAYRLGDPIEVRVEKLDRQDGKVELAPGG